MTQFRILVLFIKFVVNKNAFVSNFNSFLSKPNCINVHLSLSSADSAFLSSVSYQFDSYWSLE